MSSGEPAQRTLADCVLRTNATSVASVASTTPASGAANSSVRYCSARAAVGATRQQLRGARAAVSQQLLLLQRWQCCRGRCRVIRRVACLVRVVQVLVAAVLEHGRGDAQNRKHVVRREGWRLLPIVQELQVRPGCDILLEEGIEVVQQGDPVVHVALRAEAGRQGSSPVRGAPLSTRLGVAALARASRAPRHLLVLPLEACQRLGDAVERSAQHPICQRLDRLGLRCSGVERSARCVSSA